MLIHWSLYTFSVLAIYSCKRSLKLYFVSLKHTQNHPDHVDAEGGTIFSNEILFHYYFIVKVLSACLNTNHDDVGYK